MCCMNDKTDAACSMRFQNPWMIYSPSNTNKERHLFRVWLRMIWAHPIFGHEREFPRDVELSIHSTTNFTGRSVSRRGGKDAPVADSDLQKSRHLSTYGEGDVGALLCAVVHHSHYQLWCISEKWRLVGIISREHRSSVYHWNGLHRPGMRSIRVTGCWADATACIVMWVLGNKDCNARPWGIW